MNQWFHAADHYGSLRQAWGSKLCFVSLSASLLESLRIASRPFGLALTWRASYFSSAQKCCSRSTCSTTWSRRPFQVLWMLPRSGGNNWISDGVMRFVMVMSVTGSYEPGSNSSSSSRSAPSSSTWQLIDFVQIIEFTFHLIDNSSNKASTSFFVLHWLG